MMILRATLLQYYKQTIYPNLGIYTYKPWYIFLFEDFLKNFKLLND